MGSQLDMISTSVAVVVLVRGGNAPRGVCVNGVAIDALGELYPPWTPARTEERYFEGVEWAARFSLLSPYSYSSQGYRGLCDGLRNLAEEGIVSTTDAFVFEDRVPLYELALHEHSLLPHVSLAMGFRPDWDNEQMQHCMDYTVARQRSWEDTGWRMCLREGKFELDNIGFWSTRA